MILYLLKSSVCLALLLAIYHLFLEKEKMHQFNRFYLLGSILFSLYAPNYIIYIEAIPFNETIKPLFSTLQETSFINLENDISTLNSTSTNTINFSLILIVAYALICSLLLFRFGKNLIKLIHKIRSNKKITYQNATIVLISEKIIPHTFLNFIFINKKEFNKNAIEEELFTHELTHVSQKHTIDILLIELLHIICWFNPLIIYLKKAIKLNHEFLADDSVIHSHKNTTEYQHLLLNKAILKNNIYLASNFNYSLTKKRLIMMTKQSSQLKMLFKKIAIIPIAVGLLFLFANRVEAQQKNTDSKKVIEKKSQEKVTPEMIAEYNSLAKEMKKSTTSIFRLKDVERIKFIYNLMTDEQKKGAKPFPIIPPPPVVKLKNIPPPPPIPTNATPQQKKSYKKAIEKYKKEVKNIPPPPPPKTRKNEYKKSYKLSLVKKSPVFPDCESTSQFEIRKCLSESFTLHFKENFNFKLAKKSLKYTDKTHISTFFVITKEGYISHKGSYVLKKGRNEKITEEIKRVLNLVPQLKPGIRKGIPVGVSYGVSITLEKENIRIESKSGPY
jgi:bla regulator protein blaR1